MVGKVADFSEAWRGDGVSLAVEPDRRFKQTLNFEAIEAWRLQICGAQIELVATANSGLPVSFALISGAAKISGTTLEIRGPGPVKVEAVQKGNAFVQPVSVAQEFAVTVPNLLGCNPAPNDAFADRIRLPSLPSVSSGLATAYGSTREAWEPFQPPQPNRNGSVWWSWEAPASGRVRVSALGAGCINPFLFGITGNPSVFEVVGANDDSLREGGTNGASGFVFSATAGTTYHFAVAEMEFSYPRTYPGSDCDFTSVNAGYSLVPHEATLSLEIRTLPTPANDSPANAVLVIGDFSSVSGTNIGATADLGGEPDFGPTNRSQATVWWRWTAPRSRRVSLSTVGSEIGTVLAVFAMREGGITELVAENVVAPEFEAIRGLATGQIVIGAARPLPGDAAVLPNSRVEFEATEGHEYLIGVDGMPSPYGEPGFGAIRLHWDRIVLQGFEGAQRDTRLGPLGDPTDFWGVNMKEIVWSPMFLSLYFDYLDSIETQQPLTPGRAIVGPYGPWPWSEAEDPFDLNPLVQEVESKLTAMVVTNRLLVDPAVFGDSWVLSEATREALALHPTSGPELQRLNRLLMADALPDYLPWRRSATHVSGTLRLANFGPAPTRALRVRIVGTRVFPGTVRDRDRGASEALAAGIELGTASLNEGISASGEARVRVDFLTPPASLNGATTPAGFTYRADAVIESRVGGTWIQELVMPLFPGDLAGNTMIQKDGVGPGSGAGDVSSEGGEAATEEMKLSTYPEADSVGPGQRVQLMAQLRVQQKNAADELDVTEEVSWRFEGPGTLVRQDGKTYLELPTTSAGLPPGYGGGPVSLWCALTNGVVLTASRQLGLTGAQTITFDPPPTTTYGDPPILLSATASSSLPVVFEVVSGPATLEGSLLRPTGVGEVVLRARQPGDATYFAVSVERTVVVGRMSQTLSFAPPTSVNFGGDPVELSGTASSGLALRYEVVSGPGRLSGSVLWFTGAGTVVLRVSQEGSETYFATSTEFDIVVGKAPQTITFEVASTATQGDPPILLSAKASSGLPVFLEVVAGSATVAGNFLTLSGEGEVRLRATQAGDANWLAAEPVERSITVRPGEVSEPITLSYEIRSGSGAGDVQLRLTMSVPRGTRVAFSFSPDLIAWDALPDPEIVEGMARVQVAVPSFPAHGFYRAVTLPVLPSAP